jgi:magnesium transporter
VVNVHRRGSAWSASSRDILVVNSTLVTQAQNAEMARMTEVSRGGGDHGR